YQRLVPEVDRRFPTEDALKAFLPSITRQDARELIYGTVLDTAIEDSVDLRDSEFLDWLATPWDVRVELQSEPDAHSRGCQDRDASARSRVAAPPNGGTRVHASAARRQAVRSRCSPTSQATTTANPASNETSRSADRGPSSSARVSAADGGRGLGIMRHLLRTTVTHAPCQPRRRTEARFPDRNGRRMVRSAVGALRGLHDRSGSGGPRGAGTRGPSPTREHRPLARHAPQRVRAALVEGEAAADDDIAYRPGDEHLPRTGECGDPRGHVDGHAGEIVAAHLAFPGMYPPANCEAEPAALGHYRLSTADAAPRGVEPREHAVASRLHDAATGVLHRRPRTPVVVVQHVVPAPVSELRGAGRRVDDVREEDGRQHAVGVLRRSAAGEEFLDRLGETLARADLVQRRERERELAVARARNAGRQIAGAGDRKHRVVAVMNDERRRADRRQHVADVGLEGGTHERRCRPRRARAALHAREGLTHILGRVPESPSHHA